LSGVSSLYIRKPIIDYYFLRELKRIKELKPKIIVFIEISTYPYDKQLSGRIIYWPILIKDKIGRKYLKHYTDYLVTYSQDEFIWGIKAIRIRNGINVYSLPQIKKRLNLLFHEGIKLIGLANVNRWHGYDRVLMGLKEYYSTNPSVLVYFDIVGSGDSRTICELKEYVKSNGLDNHVFFHGPLVGEALDTVFDKAHLGIGSLANFRYDIYIESALKNREYCLRGIPFIIASRDLDFDEFPHVLRVSETETPINIHELLSFIYIQHNNSTPELIRDYAVKNLSWENKLKPIVDQIHCQLE
jgi:glycosyltransferase involved in cell wall biosynthesis